MLTLVNNGLNFLGVNSMLFLIKCVNLCVDIFFIFKIFLTLSIGHERKKNKQKTTTCPLTYN